MTFMKVIERSSKVRYLIMPYGFQTLPEEPLNQIGDNHVQQRSKVAKYFLRKVKVFVRRTTKLLLKWLRHFNKINASA